MESMKIKGMMISRMTGIDTLPKLAFLNSSGHTTASLASCDAKDHIEYLAFINLGCYLDGSNVDQRICQPGIDLLFCFNLPRSSYDLNTGDIIALTNPGT